MSKVSNNPSIDQTAFSTPSGLAGIVASLVGVLSIVTVAAVLCRYVGMACVVTTGYCFSLLLAISVMALTLTRIGLSDTHVSRRCPRWITWTRYA
ncbi:hypothetical protein [Rubripirellula reticaptiva]|uniref:Uncharacterized protein n=1 Tax=Rubripirellula reticaptiva TaxID=2528013 RepID=A0A5C6FB93_9BACT|nr:hypothetical protein [Rubripirellula reticaptiva]TWU57406.1 hypothetical protein Poly59_03130 [Rubripirellula reticaptiva]